MFNHLAPDVSLIIPIYNMERYLRKCLQSVESQTFKNFEVIFVDDGSTDSSPEILGECTFKHANYHVIRRENGGVSAARNEGVKAAKGTFIAFMDSDDYIAPDYLEKLYHTALNENADIVCCSYYLYNAITHDLKTAKFRKRPGVYGKESMIRSLIFDLGIKGFIWNKLWRRTLFTENQITFPTMCFEDISVCLRGFYGAGRIAVIESPLYYYVQHKDSTIGDLTIHKLNDYLRALAGLRGCLELKNDFAPYRPVYQLHSLFIFFTTCYLTVIAQKKLGSLRGLGGNFRRIGGACIQYNKKSFRPLPDITSYPDVIREQNGQQYEMEDSSIE